MECEMPLINSNPEEMKEIFESVKTIAILGLSPVHVAQRGSPGERVDVFPHDLAERRHFEHTPRVRIE